MVSRTRLCDSGSVQWLIDQLFHQFGEGLEDGLQCFRDHLSVDGEKLSAYVQFFMAASIVSPGENTFGDLISRSIWLSLVFV